MAPRNKKAAPRPNTYALKVRLDGMIMEMKGEAGEALAYGLGMLPIFAEEFEGSAAPPAAEVVPTEVLRETMDQAAKAYLVAAAAFYADQKRRKHSAKGSGGRA